jgi:hypothetical protein
LAATIADGICLGGSGGRAFKDTQMGAAITHSSRDGASKLLQRGCSFPECTVAPAAVSAATSVA